ncbi:MAG: VOC family protein [Cyanobacteria bacterium P01_E01_bin.42]
MTKIHYELNHVSLPVTNLDISIQFYSEVLGLEQTKRPEWVENDITLTGVWFQLSNRTQLHLFNNDGVNFRQPYLSVRDCHFAVSVKKFYEVYDLIEKRAKDFYKKFAGSNGVNKHDFILKTPFFDKGRYLNFYLLDPDNHIIEINEM